MSSQTNQSFLNRAP